MSVKFEALEAGRFLATVRQGRKVVFEDEVRIRQVRTKVDTYQGSTDPETAKSYAIFAEISAAMPAADASLEDILKFADEAGLGLPSRPRDAATAWEVVFNETGIQREDNVGGVRPVPPADAVGEEDSDVEDLQTGLEGEDEGEGDDE